MQNLTLVNIKNRLDAYLKTCHLNRIAAIGDLEIFSPPLLATARADDPLFERLKEADIIGPNHLSPREWLESAKTVISYFLPFTRQLRESNRSFGLPSTEWLYGRIEGEKFNRALAGFLLQLLNEAQYQAVSPFLDTRFQIIDRRSNWSERHIAYIAGLGTFSLSRSLITKAGAAGRCGSVVTNLVLPPTMRDYQTTEAYCIRCGACINRCPPLAIMETGKDNAICAGYLDRVLGRFRPRYGCGKCQTAVPCEEKIPHPL